MLSFYHFQTWVFSFFLLALGISIYFYTRKFLRLFSLNQPSRQVAIKQPEQKKEVKETLKSNVLIPVFMPWRKSTKSEVDSAAGKVRNKKGKVPHDPFKRVSDGSIGSFESTTTTYSGYQEPDIDSVIAGDHKRYSIFVPPQANPMDQNRNMFVEEEFRASTPKVTRMFSELSSSSRTVTRNYSQNLSKPDDLKESPTKVLDLGIPTVGLAKVATVSVKSSASVREVITKNESSLERIMITESLQQKKLEKV